MKAVSDINHLNEIVEKYFIRHTLTNSYVLIDEYKEYIQQQRLFYIANENNLILLIRKNGFYRLYYYINNINEHMLLDVSEPIVMEILYRGEKDVPHEAMKYWQNSGFKEHLTRDLMVASFQQLNMPSKVAEGVTLKHASTQEEITFTRDLLIKSLDAYTGDILTIEEVEQFAENKNIICAYCEDKPAGALQFEIKNKVVWLGHIVVDSGYRGKGIANELVRKYITDNASQPNTRYHLWVIRNNEGAVHLYRKFGFKYGNRSTVSMLKRS